MTKTKPFIITIVFAGFISLHAQGGPVVSGGNATGAGGTVSYSIGQVDYISVTGSNGNINQGLQQPFEFFTMGIEEDKDIQLEFSVYPNPTNSYILLKTDKEDLSGLYYQLFDMNGKQLSNRNISSPVTQIELEQYATGSYLLKVGNANQSLKTFKIIKK
jgi:hypothetical protein